MGKRASAIQRELHQRLPLASTREEAFLSILRTAAVVRRPVARVLEDRGLSMAQYNVLRILRGSGDAGLPTLSIRDRMIEEAAGITRLIDRLEESALVRRARGSSTDKRQVYCRITPAGQALLRELDPMVSLAVEASLSMLSELDLERLIGLLDRIRGDAPRVTSMLDRRDGPIRPRRRSSR
ncbi:MAG: MarR family winged helix-turn-helix transcriptional regulator [Gemmatimonadaceae bacterium]